ncbi:MAG: RNA polymerase sigma factor [Mycobacteriales bacterium]
MFSRQDDPLSRPEGLIRQVYSYVAYQIGSGPDAEDVTSTVFERAVRYRDAFDPGKGDAVSWLLGIARRALADHLARPVPAPLYELDLAIPGSDPGESVIRHLSLEEALAALSDSDRDLLSLRYGSDLKAREIAVVLKSNTHAVEVALGRAKARLRRLLGDSST